LGQEFALELKKVLLYQTVQQMAIMDGLTNIYVRRHFLERFEEELNRDKNHRLQLSFFMMDVDDFKSYNDNFGHLVGDAVLREVAAILRNNIREIDLLGRFGGEEFVIVFSETSKERAYQVGERIRQIIENYKFKAYDEVLKLTISGGIAGFPEDAGTKIGLIDKADRALYEAKKRGKNNIILYDKKLGG
jgi:diguanylate cyclase (GGDEF)-like protein